MGIGETMKNIFKDETTSPHSDDVDRESFSRGNARTSRAYEQSDVPNDATKTTNPERASHKLPSGTGPGTSGKATSESVMESDLARARSSQGAAGYGTDAAAATGGSLAGTHQGGRTGFAANESGQRSSTIGGTGSTATGSGQPTNTVPGTMQEVNMSETPVTTERSADTSSRAFGTGGHHIGVLDEHHAMGHRKRDVMPSGDTTEDTSQLNPVTHELVRHLETEEVKRIKDQERHIHHIQHHTQPVIAHEELPEQRKDFVHSVTRIEEQHANKVEDNTLFDGQVRQHRNSLRHGAKERTVVDKGTVVTEHIHHHVHHVIQPVIEKETVDRQFVHTTIPIKEITHEAPVVHQSQTHAPIPLEHFVERGGSLHGGVSQDDISKKVLHGGKCTREVDGVAEEIESKLHLGKESTLAKAESHSPAVKTKTTQRTTTVLEPEYHGAALPHN